MFTRSIVFEKDSLVPTHVFVWSTRKFNVSWAYARKPYTSVFQKYFEEMVEETPRKPEVRMYFEGVEENATGADVPRCSCGHTHAVHDHYRPGNDCGICGSSLCPGYIRVG